MFNNFFFKKSDKFPVPAYIRPIINGEFSVQDVGILATYTIDVATDIEFNTIIGTVSSKNLDLKTLIAGNDSNLFIRAKADDGIKSSGYSYITTKYYIQPAQTTLGLPEDLYVGDSYTISFSYDPSEYATIYQIQIADENTFSNPIFEFESGQDKYDADLSSLSLSTTYYWRVRAVNNTVYGDWSSIRSFSIEIVW